MAVMFLLKNTFRYLHTHTHTNKPRIIKRFFKNHKYIGFGIYVFCNSSGIAVGSVYVMRD